MLNPNQQRYLASHLSVIEQELTSTLAAVTAHGDAAVFPQYRNALLLEEVAKLHARLETLRAAMRRFLAAEAIPARSEGKVDARWALHTQLALLRNLVIELRPNYVRGYGELDADGTRVCQALAAELGLLLDGFDEMLRPAPMRSEPLDAGDRWAHIVGELIECYGLSEYRERWRDLASAGDSGRIEVAVLGRVSSGKSSLINALVGHAWLPVGAIPVTAITTRLCYGAAPALEIVGLDGTSSAASAGELADLVSEAGNPGNRRRLAEVRLAVPAALLKAGVTLTDTPGLGSLNAQASRHANEYLPRCDLGVVAVDATATLTRQDIDLARALQATQASVLVVLTKVDLLAAGTQQEQQHYVSRALSEALGQAVEAVLISTEPEWCVRLEAWVSVTLQPRMQECRAAAAQRRMAQRLRLARQVRLLLEQMRDERPPAAAQSFGRASLDLQQTEERLGTLIAECQAKAIAQAADATVERLLTDKDPAPPAEVFAERLAAGLDAVAREARAQLLRSVEKLAAGKEWQRQLPALPAFAPGALPAPRPAAWYAGLARRADAHRRLQPLRNASAPQVREYAERLRAWLQLALQGLRVELRRGTAVATATDPRVLAEDIQRLQMLTQGSHEDAHALC